jgi:hypothetical protein
VQAPGTFGVPGLEVGRTLAQAEAHTPESRYRRIAEFGGCSATEELHPWASQVPNANLPWAKKNRDGHLTTEPPSGTKFFFESAIGCPLGWATCARLLPPL